MFRPVPRLPKPLPYVPRPGLEKLLPYVFPDHHLFFEGKRKPYGRKKAKARQHRKEVKAHKRRMWKQGKAA